jgi:hypothetical protein
MKKIIPILIVFSSIYSNYSFSQQDSSKKINFIIKADILIPAFGLLSDYTMPSLTFETCFHNRHSVQLTGIYNYQLFENHQSSFNSNSSRKVKSFQMIPEYKFYLFKKKKYTGIFAGGFITYLSERVKSESTSDWPPYHTYLDYKKTYALFGPIIGYQNYFMKHFTLEILVGAGYYKRLSLNVYEAIHDSFTPTEDFIDTHNCIIRTSIKIGYKF